MNIIFIYLTKGSADYMGRLIIDTAFLAFAHFVEGRSVLSTGCIFLKTWGQGMGAYQQTLLLRHSRHTYNGRHSICSFEAYRRIQTKRNSNKY